MAVKRIEVSPDGAPAVDAPSNRGILAFVERAARFTATLHNRVKAHDLAGAAAELAYRLFFALFPFFIFVASLGAFLADEFGVGNPTDEIMNLIGDSLPQDLASVLRNELRDVIESTDAGLISVAVVASIWSASSCINTIIKTMNRVFEVQETRPFWRRYLQSLAVTILAGSFMVIAFILFLVGQFYGLELANELDVEGTAARLFSYARWPAAILFVLLATDFLYWHTPNIKTRFHLLSTGAVVFALGWIGATYLFGLYVANFGSYNATYGTMAAVAILLLWFYITSFLFFLGAELNAMNNASRRNNTEHQSARALAGDSS